MAQQPRVLDTQGTSSYMHICPEPPTHSPMLVVSPPSSICIGESFIEEDSTPDDGEGEGVRESSSAEATTITNTYYKSCEMMRKQIEILQ